jgi:hypothetical protein
MNSLPLTNDGPRELNSMRIILKDEKIYITYYFALTGIWIGLLSTDRLSQEKKHYQLKNHFRF